MPPLPRMSCAAAWRPSPGFRQSYTNFGKRELSNGLQSSSAPSPPWIEVNVPHSCATYRAGLFPAVSNRLDIAAADSVTEGTSHFNDLDFEFIICLMRRTLGRNRSPIVSLAQ